LTSGIEKRRNREGGRGGGIETLFKGLIE